MLYQQRGGVRLRVDTVNNDFDPSKAAREIGSHVAHVFAINVYYVFDKIWSTHEVLGAYTKHYRTDNSTPGLYKS